jgi:hypothetical protein
VQRVSNDRRKHKIELGTVSVRGVRTPNDGSLALARIMLTTLLRPSSQETATAEVGRVLCV